MPKARRTRNRIAALIGGIFVRLVYAVVTGLFGAALLHLVIIFALPRFTGRDAYTRVLETGPAGQFHRLEKGKTAGPLASEDPFVEASVCALDLSDGAVAITASGEPAFWSFAVFDATANEVFSMSDRSVDTNRLDAIVATPTQAAQLRRSDPEISQKRILIEMDGKNGYLVLRALAPHQSQENAARSFLDSASCAVMPAL